MIAILDGLPAAPLSESGRRGQVLRLPARGRATVLREAKVYADQILGTYGLKLGGLAPYGTQELLSATQRWELYQTCPDLRSTVDSVVRRLSTWPWRISLRPDVAPNDPNREAAVAAAAEATRFLRLPTSDGLTWQGLIEIVARDWLVQPAGVLYMPRVRDRGAAGRGISELTWLAGSEVYPTLNALGRTVGYAQVTGVTSDAEELDSDEIIYLPMSRSSWSPVGLPLIDSVWLEAVALMRSTVRYFREVDTDELGDGLLAVDGLAGSAFDALVQDLRDRKPHELKAIGGPGVDAKWVSFKRAFAEIQATEVWRLIQHRIYRLFGVQPVELGDTDDANRATAVVAIDAGQSHLLDPMADALEVQIDTRVLPEIVEPALAAMLVFAFDRTQRLTPEEREQRSREHERYLKLGVLSVNEVRTDLGLAALDNTGDEHRVDTPFGWVALDAAPLGTSGPVGGAASLAQPRPPRPPRRLAARELPSDWPSAAVFDGYRVLDLRALASEVSGYTDDVQAAWRAARVAILREVELAYKPGATVTAAMVAALGRIQGDLDDLVQTWSTRTAPRYDAAAKLARDAATDYAGAPVVEDWEERASLYQDAAMGYLVAADGPVQTVATKLNLLLLAVSRQGRAPAETRAVEPLGPEASAGEVLAAAAAIVDGQEYRIGNWSGKLVELANKVFGAGLVEGGGEPGAPGEWMGEWVHVGDEAMCPTCTVEGAVGFRPLSEFPIMPGGATECGAKDRCVVVAWLRSEVDAKTAVKLSPILGETAE